MVWEEVSLERRGVWPLMVVVGESGNQGPLRACYRSRQVRQRVHRYK